MLTEGCQADCQNPRVEKPGAYRLHRRCLCVRARVCPCTCPYVHSPPPGPTLQQLKGIGLPVTGTCSRCGFLISLSFRRPLSWSICQILPLPLSPAPL